MFTWIRSIFFRLQEYVVDLSCWGTTGAGRCEANNIAFSKPHIPTLGAFFAVYQSYILLYYIRDCSQVWFSNIYIYIAIYI